MSASGYMAYIRDSHIMARRIKNDKTYRVAKINVYDGGVSVYDDAVVAHVHMKEVEDRENAITIPWHYFDESLKAAIRNAGFEDVECY